MHICIAGWYFNQEFLNFMKKVNERFNVGIVAHRQGDGNGLPVIQIENVGLEFGCYDYYLKNIWEGDHNVLFMHDDIVVNPVMVNFEIIPPINIIHKISELKIDQGYVFQNEDDAQWNACKHGRMIFMSKRLLRRLKDDGGFPFDADNTGQTMSGPYNDGIVNFHDKMLEYTKEFNTCNLIFAPAFTMLRRNGAVPNAINAV